MILTFQHNEGSDLWHDHDHFPDAIVRRFLEDYDDTPDLHRRIIRCFHDNITDKQIYNLITFFRDLRFASDDTIFEKDQHKEILKDLYFHRRNQPVKLEKVMFAVNCNNWYKQERIVGVRVIHENYFRVKKTIYAVERSIHHWRADDVIFAR